MIGHPEKTALYGTRFCSVPGMGRGEGNWIGICWGEEKHRHLQNYVKELLHLYKSNPACYEADNHPTGFEWINADDGDKVFSVFVRHSALTVRITCFSL